MNEELKIIISAEIEKLQKGVDNAQKKLQNFQKKTKIGSQEFNDVMKRMGDASKRAMAIAAGAFAGAAAALMALADSTEDYRIKMSNLFTNFEMAGSSEEVAREAFEEFFKVLGDYDEAFEVASIAAQITLDPKELSDLATVVAGIETKIPASIDTAGLMESIMEAIGTGEVSGPLADAFTFTGDIDGLADLQDALFYTEDTGKRTQLIMDALKDSFKGTGEAARKNAEKIEKSREALLNKQDAMARLGEAAAPLKAAFDNAAAALADTLAPMIEDFMENHGDAFAACLENIAIAIGEIITWIVDNWETIANIATVVGVIVAAIWLYNTATGVAAAVTTLLASPIYLVVAAIAAVIAIIALCVIYWEEIGEVAAAVWDWIKGIWEKVAGWFNDYVIKPVVNFFKGLWDGIKTGASNLWEGIKNIFKAVGGWFNDYVIKPVGKFFSGMWDGLKNGASKAWEGIKNVFKGFGKFFSDIFTNAWQGVKNVFSFGGKIFDGIVDGIITAFKFVVNGIIDGINFVVAMPFKGLNGILDTIHGISILGVKPFSWLTWRAPVPQIPKLAKGGVVDSATIAMIGEQGKEAVVPLENNTEWIDKLSNTLADRLNGGNTPIVLTVDGKAFAQTTINTLNARTRQTGKLDLVLV